MPPRNHSHNPQTEISHTNPHARLHSSQLCVIHSDGFYSRVCRKKFQLSITCSNCFVCNSWNPFQQRPVFKCAGTSRGQTPVHEGPKTEDNQQPGQRERSTYTTKTVASRKRKKIGGGDVERRGGNEGEVEGEGGGGGGG